jgi:hypothetical protein
MKSGKYGMNRKKQKAKQFLSKLNQVQLFPYAGASSSLLLVASAARARVAARAFGWR